MKFSDIKKFPNIHYYCNISLDYLSSVLDRYQMEHNLNMHPDFQRGHVWTVEQQVKYVAWLFSS